MKGDLHDVGKNLVSMMLEGSGYEIVDLGVDVSPPRGSSRLSGTVRTWSAMSALLTTTMPRMHENIAAIEKAGLRDEALVVDRRRADHRAVRAGDRCRRVRPGRVERSADGAAPARGQGLARLEGQRAAMLNTPSAPPAESTASPAASKRWSRRGSKRTATTSPGLSSIVDGASALMTRSPSVRSTIVSPPSGSVA